MSSSVGRVRNAASDSGFAHLSFQYLKESVTTGINFFAESCGGKGLIAIDFDATIIQVHTYGIWSGDASALAAHVRPVFVALLQTAVPMDNVTVAVVTFSGQVGLIREVLVSQSDTNLFYLRCWLKYNFYLFL